MTDWIQKRFDREQQAKQQREAKEKADAEMSGRVTGSIPRFLDAFHLEMERQVADYNRIYAREAKFVLKPTGEVYVEQLEFPAGYINALHDLHGHHLTVSVARARTANERSEVATRYDFRFDGQNLQAHNAGRFYSPAALVQELLEKALFD